MLALDAIDPYLGTLCKDVLLIESGVTAHLHMHFPSGSGDGRAEDAYAGELRETLRAHRASGQRVALAPHWSDRSRLAYDGDDAFIASLPGELQDRARRLAGARMPADAYLDTIRELIGELSGDPLLSAQFAIMAPQWASDGLVEAVGSAAAELAAGIHLHALESRLQRAWGDAFAGGRELERLADAGVLGDRSALAHGVWLRDSDVDLLARTGATVVHNCSSNLRLATGVAPLRQLVAAGVSVALGLDDMGLADDDDMFAEVRIAHVLQRVHGEPEHPRLDPARLFGLAWDGGARVVGAAAAIGRLEPGQARRRRRARPPGAARAVRRRRRRHLGAPRDAREGGARGQRDRRRAPADAAGAGSSTSTATRSWRRSPAPPRRPWRGGARRRPPGSSRFGAGSPSTTRGRCGTTARPDRPTRLPA